MWEQLALFWLWIEQPTNVTLKQSERISTNVIVVEINHSAITTYTIVIDSQQLTRSIVNAVAPSLQMDWWVFGKLGRIPTRETMTRVQRTLIKKLIINSFLDAVIYIEVSSARDAHSNLSPSCFEPQGSLNALSQYFKGLISEVKQSLCEAGAAAELHFWLRTSRWRAFFWKLLLWTSEKSLHSADWMKRNEQTH